MAEWPATGPENRGVVMSDGRSIRLPSAKFAQVRGPGRNGPAVTRSPLVGRGGSNPPLCTKCPRARIGIAACLRNRGLRVRISPLAPDVLDRQTLSQRPTLRLDNKMKIILESDDAADFIRHVEHAVNGVFRRHSPETGVLVKINNWFGSNWLGFSGKTLGALGDWYKPHNQPLDNIRIPPVVPARVVLQRR